MPDTTDPDLSYADFVVRIGYRLLSGLGALWLDGPTQNPNEALTIVDDAARLQAARDYWTGVFAPWIPDLSVLDTSPPPAIAFSLAASAPSARDAVANRRKLHAVSGEALPDVFFQDYRCMVAMDEIASFVTPFDVFTGPDLLSLMRRTLLGQTGSLPRELQAVGVQAARQVHEVLRRFDYVSRLSMAPSSNQASFTELMALYRLEGNFCCTPPERSFAHGPLTATPNGTCREPDVYRDKEKLEKDKTAGRPGWVLWVTESDAMIARDNGYRFALAVENLNFLGGLDALTTWSLQPGDELRAIAEADLTTNSWRTGYLAKRGELSAEFKAIFDRLIETLWMSSLETQVTLPPVLSSLDTAYDELNELMATHKPHPDPSAPANAGRIYLLGDDYGNSTFDALKVAARWYQSRMNPATLLAWRDRDLGMLMPRFGPYTAYLRYHLGDVLFMGVFIRLVKDLSLLSNTWEVDETRPARANWKNAIPDNRWLPSLLSTAGWTSSAASAHSASMRAALDFWRQDAVYYNPPHIDNHLFPRGELIWRTVGLPQKWRSVRAVPSWFPGSGAPSATAVQAADTAKTVMTIVRDNALIPAIDAALEYSLHTQLFSVPSMRDRRHLKRNFAVAENYRRLHLFLEAARQQSGLDINGN